MLSSPTIPSQLSPQPHWSPLDASLITSQPIPSPTSSRSTPVPLPQPTRPHSTPVPTPHNSHPLTQCPSPLSSPHNPPHSPTRLPSPHLSPHPSCYFTLQAPHLQPHPQASSCTSVAACAPYRGAPAGLQPIGVQNAAIVSRLFCLQLLSFPASSSAPFPPEAAGPGSSQGHTPRPAVATHPLTKRAPGTAGCGGLISFISVFACFDSPIKVKCSF